MTRFDTMNLNTPHTDREMDMLPQGATGDMGMPMSGDHSGDGNKMGSERQRKVVEASAGGAPVWEPYPGAFDSILGPEVDDEEDEDHGSSSATHCHACARALSKDTIVDDKLWSEISPTKSEGGMLCACCMVERIAAVRPDWPAVRLSSSQAATPERSGQVTPPMIDAPLNAAAPEAGEVERWSVRPWDMHTATMIADKEGGYVRFRDYAIQQARLAEMGAEISAIGDELASIIRDMIRTFPDRAKAGIEARLAALSQPVERAEGGV